MVQRAVGFTNEWQSCPTGCLTTSTAKSGRIQCQTQWNGQDRRTERKRWGDGYSEGDNWLTKPSLDCGCRCRLPRQRALTTCCQALTGQSRFTYPTTSTPWMHVAPPNPARVDPKTPHQPHRPARWWSPNCKHLCDRPLQSRRVRVAWTRRAPDPLAPHESRMCVGGPWALARAENSATRNRTRCRTQQSLRRGVPPADEVSCLCQACI